MKTDGSSTRPSLRRPETGAVLVVVLLAMIALLGMGLTGLYLTSGSIQMSANINMRNQALYVAEGGIQAAKEVLNRNVPGMPAYPNLSRMLAGADPMGNAIPLPAGFVDEIPGNNANLDDPTDFGCLGRTGNGTFTRGAYLRDVPGRGCQGGTSAFIDCNYPPVYPNIVAHDEAPPNSNTMSAAPTQYMGRYTLFIRQDLAECRLGLFTSEGPTPPP
ncbi:MAG TPA: pilus assembly PilX N-terminal domain-containing protein, partial [Polyangia bacterium]|nr:pilus assembly PilX N-terminal domain-containing protein [Polyangia bacterium]